MDKSLPASWQQVLAKEMALPGFQQLEQFVDAERMAHAVFPPEPDVFQALHLTPLEQVKVVLLGQDPYYNEGQAHGLCFSVRAGIKKPPSLVNIFKELESNLGCPVPNDTLDAVGSNT